MFRVLQHRALVLNRGRTFGVVVVGLKFRSSGLL